MHYETIIGLEVHVQLQTQTKIFCGCTSAFNPDNPNVQTCPVCLGLPGSLPVMNRTAFRLSLKTALALGCDIARFTKLDRKQYYAASEATSEAKAAARHLYWLPRRGLILTNKLVSYRAQAPIPRAERNETFE